MKADFKWILFIPLFFFFMPAFVIPIPVGNIFFLAYFLVLYAVILFLLIKDNKKIILRIRHIAKKTPLKMYFLVLGLITVNMLFLITTGRMSLHRFLISLFYNITLQILPILLYFIYIIDNYISYEKFMRFFIILFWCSLIFGFIGYAGQYFNISFILDIFNFLSNGRAMAWEKSGIGLLSEASDYTAFGLPRLDNLFQEPSEYSHYLCMFLPLVIAVADSKFKLSGSKFINFAVKKTILLFTIASIILSLSPTALILCILLVFICRYRAVLKFMKKYYLVFISILPVIFFAVKSIDLSETYLSRIVNVLTQIHSFEDFIMVEGSLATRIICYINTLCVFAHHPFTGVGMGNLPYYMVNQFENSPVPLTGELIARNTLLVKGGGPALFCNDYLYTFIAENGIFIFSVFVCFYLRLFKGMNRIMKSYDGCSFEYTVAKGMKGVLLSIFLIGLYNLTASDLIMPMYFAWALAVSILYRCRTAGKS